jgi:hypothetical protein
MDPPHGIRLAFDRYREHLKANRGRFSASLCEIAVSEWYYDFNDARCPNYAVLENASLKEVTQDEETGARRMSVTLKLQGFHYDDVVHFQFHYPEVFFYRMESAHRLIARRTWRYDEFRLSEDGSVLHEIEWAGTGNWLIEASDVQFRCVVQPNLQTRQ